MNIARMRKYDVAAEHRRIDIFRYISFYAITLAKCWNRLAL